MHYLVMYTYVPRDVNAGYQQGGAIVESETGVMDAITTALSKLGMMDLEDDVVSQYLGQSAEDDTSEGYAWRVNAAGGDYYFIWIPREGSSGECMGLNSWKWFGLVNAELPS